MRTIGEKEYSHELLGDRFQSALSDHDTRRRVEVLVDEFLTDEMIGGKRVLDVGCGLGFFSERLVQRGAHVTACDIGPGLVQRTRQRVGCEAVVADALTLEERFGSGVFDVVVSSECIEHTPDPAGCVAQMARVLRPGGRLSFSTPNQVWAPVVRLATRLKLRPFNGLENFSSWGNLRRTLADQGLVLEQEKGLHLFPFQLPLHGLSTWCDNHLQALRGVMINICLLCRKAG
ncbi:MAG: methyltransferase domain-containing protein [Verrucomicrobia bacterium]|nr:methyltransferase domain-containing protein [Verrucomicrobiota bacterium]